MIKGFVLFFLSVIFLFSVPLFATPQCSDPSIFKVGVGKADITGPAAEQGMMGYGMLEQKTAGISQRLWARAFLIAGCNDKEVVLVNVDLGQVFQGVKQAVIKKLQGTGFNDDNVLITANHTHSGPGGYSTYTFYNLTTLGFSKENFNVITDGIVAAIKQAQQTRRLARIKIGRGALHGISHNRSPLAYLQNPSEERDRYPNNYNPDMTLLRFEDLQGKPFAMWNWFALHGVSFNNKNRLISGDNKGYAEYLFEQDFVNNDQGPFVAAFAQGNAGDVSPNPLGRQGGAGLAGLQAVEKAGKAQYQHAKKLFEDAQTFLQGSVQYRHRYIAMDKVSLTAFLPEKQQTCTAAIGVSMLAGTQDGEGIGEQGLTCETIKQKLPHFICEMNTTPCQGKKPIAITTGNKFPYPWTPNILPLQVVKVGQLLIGALPFELTTMAGRRIETSLQPVANKNNPVVLASLANAYAGYVATAEEYQIQRYEGASTHFGPHTLLALQQEMSKLTQALVFDVPLSKGPMPLDLTHSQINLQPGVVYDDVPFGKHFGDVERNVAPNYQAGETVEVVFWGAHPKNNYHSNGTFLEVQRFVAGKWQTIRNDNDWDTEYHWQRRNLAASLIKIVWRTPQDLTPGRYRIVHYGDAKAFFGGKITPYIAYSGIFQVK